MPFSHLCDMTPEVGVTGCPHDRIVKGRHASTIDGIDVGMTLNEQPDKLDVAHLARQMEGCRTPSRPSLNFCLSIDH
jgi:hypothetical protein